MTNQSQYDREEEDIEQRESDGLITRDEANAELRELRRDYAAERDEAVERAADRERENW
jgi:hypothetical protein